ncbi:MAG: PAS domain-containing protein [Cypionkella sp.]
MPTTDPSSWPAGAEPAREFRDEQARLSVLAAHGVDAIGPAGDPELSEIAEFAARLCGAPVGLVNLVLADRQQFVGRSGSDMAEPPLSSSFCVHGLGSGDLLVIPDAASDPVFAANPLVTGEPNIRFYAGAPLISREGAPLGYLCVIDPLPRAAGLTDLQRQGLQVLARAAMRRLNALRQHRAALDQITESARTMREIADLLPAIIWSADGEGNFDYFNQRWRGITGRPPPRTTEDWRPVVHPDDSDKAFGAWAESYQAGRPFESEYRLRQADGSWRWTLSRAIGMQGPDGKIVRWYGTLTDVDDGRRLSENRDVLARELSHRIKNIFAVVAGLISIRARRHPSVSEFAAELIDAIRALGRAHDFVRPVEGAKGDSLKGLLQELMAPYADEAGRVAIDGTDCAIGARAATPLALIFHELATNSAKYGALSQAGGAVSIALACDDPQGAVRVAWRERGGPKASEPGSEGFGSRLVQMAIEGQLGGTLERRFEPEGLAVDLTLPRAAMRS